MQEQIKSATIYYKNVHIVYNIIYNGKYFLERRWLIMEDDEIVNLYWERQECAIEETKKKYGRKLLYVIRNILSCSQDGEEWENDTYLGAWNAMPDARPASLPAFLCRIAKNLAFKKYSYLSADKRNCDVEIAFDELEGVIGGQAVEQEIIAKQTADAINKFLEKKKPLHRKIFVRRYYFYEPARSIAAHSGLSQSAVKSILFRLRRDLKKYLEKEGLL